MRLTCPNCGAQYEVPEDVIPEAGRDVQCSNCGDTWFQAHPDHPLPGDDSDDEIAADAWEDVPPAPTPEPAPEPTPEPAPDRRRMDPDVADVLREEAQREQRARAAEAGGLETQPDLGLDDSHDDISEEERRSREARSRMARLRGDDADTATPEPDVTIDPTSRRSLFPDIEEINSSLSSDDDPQADMDMPDPYPEAPPRARGGFRRGFMLILLLAVAALLIYVFAAPLARMLPAFEAVLSDYVTWVDGLRNWLDSQIAALMAALDGMASESDTAPAEQPAQNGG